MTSPDPGIAAILRETDRERYLSTLFVPERHRAAVQALWAFNAEVAAIASRVTDPAAGEIRLAWWRDALTGAGHGDVQRSPVAAAVMATCETYALPVAPLVNLIEARRFDLYSDAMTDSTEFERYAGETTSVLYQLGAGILGDGTLPASGDAAGHAGVATAFVGHLLAFTQNARRGRLFLPLDVFRSVGLSSREEVLADPVSPAATAALQLTADIADEHLERAVLAVGALPLALRPAFAPLPVLRQSVSRIARGHVRPMPHWQQLATMAVWLLRQRQTPAR